MPDKTPYGTWRFWLALTQAFVAKRSNWASDLYADRHRRVR